jgi:DNA-binding transcriptional MerR regulator
MEKYTAKQVTEILQEEGIDINLRTVRYYTQIGIIPPLDLVGNQRVYTSKHLHYFRAVATLSKSGESLSNVKNLIKEMNMEEIENLAKQVPFYQLGRIVDQEVYKVSEDVYVTLNRNISPDTKQRVVDSVTCILRNGNNEC